MKRRKPLCSLGTTIALFAWLVAAVSLGIADIIINKNISEDVQLNASLQSMRVARAVANTPLIIEALTGKRNETEIQAYTQKILNASGVNFITVIDRNRIRKSHPNPDKIGEFYVESDADAAFAGREATSVNKGSLGVSIRAFSPVFAPDGQQVGVILVGIMVENVQQTITKNREGTYVGSGVGILVGGMGSLLLARKIKKSMFGLEPFAIARLFEERNAMLQSVREGILAVDKDSRVTIVNEEAKRLFERAGIHHDLFGKKVDEYVPNTRLQQVLDTGKVELDQEQDLNGITILANRIPVIVNDEIVGVIATFRDKTEIRKMAEKLTGVSIYAEALRAQTHEFMNKLHVIQGMVRMECYDRLSNYINQIASNYHVEVGSVVRKIKDPVFAGFLIGKLSLAREAGVTVTVSEGSYLPEPAEPEMVHELITILGNLLNNSFDAVSQTVSKQVAVDFSWDDDILTIEVSDSGSGIAVKDQDRIFTAGYSTKGANRGLGLHLIKQSVERLGGMISVISAPGKGALFQVTIPYWSKE